MNRHAASLLYFLAAHAEPAEVYADPPMRHKISCPLRVQTLQDIIEKVPLDQTSSSNFRVIA